MDHDSRLDVPIKGYHMIPDTTSGLFFSRSHLGLSSEVNVNAHEDRWNERLRLQEEQRLEEQKQQQEQRTQF